MWSLGGSQQPEVYWAISGMVTNKKKNDQPGDPGASLLLTSEKVGGWSSIFMVIDPCWQKVTQIFVAPHLRKN